MWKSRDKLDIGNP